MINIGTKHHLLGQLAAAVAVVSLILSVISRIIGQNLGLAQGSYMSLATVAIIFALYFLVEGAVYAAKKAE